MITDDTAAYLGGFGTESQQQLFQDAAERIQEIYRERHPGDLEDMAAMIADQLSGAAQYALGDETLESLSRRVTAATQRLAVARDELSGAMIAADIQGVPLSTIAAQAEVTRVTVYKKIGR